MNINTLRPNSPTNNVNNNNSNVINYNLSTNNTATDVKVASTANIVLEKLTDTFHNTLLRPLFFGTDAVKQRVPVPVLPKNTNNNNSSTGQTLLSAFTDNKSKSISPVFLGLSSDSEVDILPQENERLQGDVKKSSPVTVFPEITNNNNSSTDQTLLPVFTDNKSKSTSSGSKVDILFQENERTQEALKCIKDTQCDQSKLLKEINKKIDSIISQRLGTICGQSSSSHNNANNHSSHSISKSIDNSNSSNENLSAINSSTSNSPSSYKTYNANNHSSHSILKTIDNSNSSNENLSRTNSSTSNSPIDLKKDNNED